MSFWNWLKSFRSKEASSPSFQNAEQTYHILEVTSGDDLEQRIRRGYDGDAWGYFDYRIGDVAAGRYLIFSSKTRLEGSFAILVTFDGITFYSPLMEGGAGTYAVAASDVYPERRTVQLGTALRLAKYYFEHRELDPSVKWIAYTGTGFITPETAPELRDDRDQLRMMEIIRLLAKAPQGSIEQEQLSAELDDIQKRMDDLP